MRDTVNIDGIGVVIEISWGIVFCEKVMAIELKPAPDTVFKFRCPGILTDGLQATEIISSVEIVYPPLCGQLTIVP